MNADRTLFHAIIVVFPFLVFLVLLLPFRVKSRWALAALLSTSLTWVLWLWIQPYNFGAVVAGVLATWGGCLLGKGPTAYPIWTRRLMFTPQSLAVYDLIAYRLSMRGRLVRTAIPCTLIGSWGMSMIYELFWYQGYNVSLLIVLGAVSFCYGVTLASLLNKRAGVYVDKSVMVPGLTTIFRDSSKTRPTIPSVTLTLSCRLNRTDALVFNNILVTPFLNLTASNKADLDDLFAEGHLDEGTYYLAGYPDKGPRAILKIGFTNDLSIYERDINQGKVAEALYLEPATGFMGNILDLIRDRQGRRTKVAEVWWFHGSPTAEQEWHTFMETFAHQVNEQIFFAPVKPRIKTGPLDFRKPTGSDLVTVSMELYGTDVK